MSGSGFPFRHAIELLQSQILYDLPQILVVKLEDNLKAIEFTIPAELRARLDEVGVPATIHPYEFFEPFIQTMIHGSSPVKAWRPAHKKNKAASRKEIAGVAVDA